MSSVILDTGPLVAYLCVEERQHAWVRAQFESFAGPLITCEPVWVEAMHLVRKRGGNRDDLWPFLRTGAIRFAFDLETEFESVAILLRRYADVPMDLADACLVRMSELQRDSHVFTTDRHFGFYRRFARQVIPLISPF